MVTKPAREFTDAFGRRKVKGNMDIELALDMIEMAQHMDHLVLFSGDGDFKRLIQVVQNKGVRVSVVSTIETNPAMVADELRRQADHFIELSKLAQHIARDGSAEERRESQAARRAQFEESKNVAESEERTSSMAL